MKVDFVRNAHGLSYRVIYCWFIDNRSYFVWKGKSQIKTQTRLILETVQNGETIAIKDIYPVSNEGDA